MLAKISMAGSDCAVEQKRDPVAALGAEVCVGD